MYKVERIEVGSIGVNKAEEILNKSKGITCYRFEKDYHDPKFADDIVTVYGKDKVAIRDWYRTHAEANDWSTDCINLTGKIVEVTGCNNCHCNICNEQSYECCNKCIGFREYHEGSEVDNGFCTDGCNKCKDSNIKGTSELDTLLKNNKDEEYSIPGWKRVPDENIDYKHLSFKTDKVYVFSYDGAEVTFYPGGLVECCNFKFTILTPQMLDAITKISNDLKDAPNAITYTFKQLN